jgi:Putative serine esterase (DUF676)
MRPATTFSFVFAVILLQSCTGTVYRPNSPVDSPRTDPDPVLRIDQMSNCDGRMNDGLVIDPEAATTLMVHGCNYRDGAFFALSKEFKRHRQQAFCFHYDDRDSLDVSADQLVTAIEAIEKRLRNNRLTIFSHSQGGLIARRALVGERTTNLSTTRADLRLITLSSPFRGIQIAKHCSWPWLAVASLGASTAICWAISGDKWYEITEKSGFMKSPGTLIPQVRTHIKINTDEEGECAVFRADGVCRRWDFLFSLQEQKNPAVDDDPRTRNFVLKDGHSKVVGNKDSPPQKLIEFLQEQRILAIGTRDWRGHFAIAAPAGDPADAWLW